MRIYDVIIIGGGVVGAAIARELSRYRLNIALLEKEEELAFGVSKSNSGIIHPGTQIAPHLLKGRLCVQGNRLVRRYAAEWGVDFKEVGELIVVFSEEEKERLLQIKKDAEALGVPGLRIVGRDWLKIHEPNISPSVILALHAPTAGIISPYRFVYALAENAVKNGVTFCTQTKVESIAASNPFEIFTSSGTYLTRFVINAAGLFADEVSRMVGVDDFKITPRKGEEYLLDKKRGHLTNHLIFPLPEKKTKGILMIKTSDGNPMIGPTAQDTQDKEDLATTDEGLRKVLEGAQKLVPSVSRSDIIAYFAGLRPCAGEDFMIRHEKGVPGFINVAGIQSPGLTAAPALALKVVGILKDQGLTLKRKLVFRKYRKKTIHLFDLSFAETKKIIKKDGAYGDMVCRCEMVSAKEIRDAIAQGARTLDGIKFRTRAQAGRCHGGFCTTRIMKILAQEKGVPLTAVTKRGAGSEIALGQREGVDPFLNPHGNQVQRKSRMLERELVIVGGGPAGMAAALSAHENGVRDILLLERDQYLGGILNQCIHTGFGLTFFKEVLTGPEYADRFIKKIQSLKEVEISFRSLAVRLTKDKVLTYLKPGCLAQVRGKALIMATGAREKTREMIPISGTRPAGIFSAGLAQKLINIEGLLPGKEVVIVGSGDIGLIMARRFVLEGSNVKGVIEIQKKSRGLIRNVVPCVEDFAIPFYLSHKVTRIFGKDRVEAVECARVDENFNEVPGSRFEIFCDTVLISVGLIPENELIEMAGAALDKKTNTPIADGVNTTSIPGLFVCGNSFQIYDVADSVTRDSEIAGKMAAAYVKSLK